MWTRGKCQQSLHAGEGDTPPPSGPLLVTCPILFFSFFPPPLIVFLNLYFSLPFLKKLYFYGILFPWNCQLMLSSFLWCVVKVKLFSCVRLLYDLMDCSTPGSSVHGILQARILEWVVISFSKGIFLTLGSNSGLPHCRQTLLSEPPGNPWYVVSIFKPEENHVPRCETSLCSLQGCRSQAVEQTSRLMLLLLELRHLMPFCFL